MSRRIKLKDGSQVEKCPKCGNNIEFDIHSQQVAEDCCEIWASCVCGFDPTSHENMGSNYRLEKHRQESIIISANYTESVGRKIKT